jgi:hypothetical protein
MLGGGGGGGNGTIAKTPEYIGLPAVLHDAKRMKLFIPAVCTAKSLAIFRVICAINSKYRKFFGKCQVFFAFYHFF